MQSKYINKLGSIQLNPKMKKNIFLIILLVLLSLSGKAQVKGEGYYKDIFFDSGVYLDLRYTLSAIDSLGLSYERVSTSDSIIQSRIIIGDSIDYNGVLLYPDNQPRFRCFQANGGVGSNHGRSLTSVGRKRIYDFFMNGGSYTGTCAGAYMSSFHWDTVGINEFYYHLWPGRVVESKSYFAETGHIFEFNCPLKNFGSFGNDNCVRDVFHNAGCYANERTGLPEGTEVLMRYDYPEHKIDKMASCWSYKPTNLTGRLVVIGSHPEINKDGDQLELMKAMIGYALDGNGEQIIKDTLKCSLPIKMNKETWENDPKHTKIGDKQYHHFIINLSQDVFDFKIIIDGKNSSDMHIYLSKDKLAFNSSATYSNKTIEPNKTLTIECLEKGTYYISVFCNKTITATDDEWGFKYSGDLEVLNGYYYQITTEWNHH